MQYLSLLPIIIAVWSCERHSVKGVLSGESIASRSAITTDVESVVIGFALDGEVAAKHKKLVGINYIAQ